ncbi:MAG: ferredoxin [Planctomycetota bacterium]|nr:ferredoxin [Planctomycetota bacterium]
MADKANRHKENVAGAFYTDTQCSMCQLCIDSAPEHFKAEEDHAVVQKQPTTDEEKTRCQEAMDSCPAQAIGNDGA